MIATLRKTYDLTVRKHVRFGHTLIILMNFYFNLHRGANFVSAADYLAYVPSENIVLNCGSSAEQSHLLYDGRNWSTDIGSQFAASNSDSNSKSNSTVSTASNGMAVPEIPYMTARLFYSKFSYNFNVTSGPKFIRLYFYSASYSGLDASDSFLTVTAGRYTLLRNFSSFLTSKYLDEDYFFKEFIVHVENYALELTFSPSSNAPNAFAFVNGIEVVSMPLHLYTRGGEVPLPFVGFLPNVLRLDNSSALETVYRVNVGGHTISPDQDTGMFRTWNADESYIFGAAFGQIDYDTRIQFPKTIPAYTAPGDVYRTARSMGQYNEINNNYNLSWFFPVDTGFKYLIRLHFCEIVPRMTLENQRVFFIFINNQTAEVQADVMVWSKGHGVPVYRDYVVMIPKLAFPKQDLWLELHPNIRVKPEYYDAILNGVEIFKISDYYGDLAGLNPPLDPSPASPSNKPKKGSQWKMKYYLVGGTLLPFTFISSAALLLIIRTKKNKRKMKKTDKDSSYFRIFHINEIRKATNNFDESNVIGKWNFGEVYKGYITGVDTAVAIKRGSKATTDECFSEEIKMFSQIRHNNVSSLLGYCAEDLQMILVYEYTANGSLSDHLYVDDQRKKPLTWNQRLEICLGVARGLHYLHTGKKRPMVHCKISAANILLDINWRAKISSFETNMASYDSSGSDASLDLDYWDREITEKGDVYLFGLVLLEVLSGRPAAIDTKAENDENGDICDDDHESLIPPVSCYLEKEDGDELVDQHLKGKIPSESLRKFVKITKQCLTRKRVKRPTMSEVLYNLEQLLVRGDSDSNASPEGLFHLESSSDLMFGVEFSEIMMSSGR